MNDFLGSDPFQSGSLLDDFGVLGSNLELNQHDNNLDSFPNLQDSFPDLQDSLVTDHDFSRPADSLHNSHDYDWLNDGNRDQDYGFGGTNYSDPHSGYGYGTDEIGYEHQGYGHPSYGDYDHSPNYYSQDESDSLDYPSHGSAKEAYSDSSSQHRSFRSGIDVYHHHEHVIKKDYSESYDPYGNPGDRSDDDSSYVDNDGNGDNDDSNSSYVDNDGDD